MMDSVRYFAGADVDWAHAHIMQGGREIEPADVRQGNEGIGPIAGDRLSAHYAFKNGVCAHFESQPGDVETGVNSRWFGFEAHGTEGIIALRNSPNGEMYIHRHGMFIPTTARCRRYALCSTSGRPFPPISARTTAICSSCANSCKP